VVETEPQKVAYLRLCCLKQGREHVRTGDVAHEIQIVGAARADEKDHARLGKRRSQRYKATVFLGGNQQQVTAPEHLPPGALIGTGCEDCIRVAFGQQLSPPARL
jgi:hypothetical protein